MPNRRSLLITGAAAALAALTANRSIASGPGAAGWPRPLREGSRLRAVNPGTWMDPDRDLTPLQERCSALGWQLEIPTHVKGQWRYFSGTDRERRAALMEAWHDPDVDAVISLGGGWGGARVLEAGFRFPRRAKWSLGFSDTSSLLLSGRPVDSLKGLGLRQGVAEGPLVVSNLTVATHLIGTPWLPSLDGALLVLEDVGEAPYRVDRMLTQWRSSGLLSRLSGIACGRFSWDEEDVLPGDFSMEEILEERLGSLGIPVVLNLPMGHGLPNQALPLGAMARLDGREGTLELLS
jgi:muramoyltetrapeptide carboxypeptidase